MLIARCAWHASFRGYPRLLRVLSWRGRGVSFSDTICPSCADRVRIERLWGTSPPPPVWPGSPQTALIFVGLPLLTILVLLATPLHEPGPPPPRPDPAAVIAEALPPRGALAETATAALPHAVIRRDRADRDHVPAVIHDTRRPRYRPAAESRRPVASASAPVVMARTGASVAPQSP
jgi:hypothetical protein